MKKLTLIIASILLASISYGQIIKIQGGISSSKIDWELQNLNVSPFYIDNLIGYSAFVGMDYMDKKFFNLSSNIGIVKKGGKDEFPLTDAFGEFTGETIIDKPSLEYLTINTLFEVKYNIKEVISPFISLGPRFDYLVKNSYHFDDIEDIGTLKKISVGIILGGGIKYDLNKFQLGLRYDYLLNFNNIAEWKVETSDVSGEITDNTFTVNLTFGYKL